MVFLLLLIMAVAIPPILLSPFPIGVRAIISIVGLAGAYLLLVGRPPSDHDWNGVFIFAIGFGFFLRALLDAGIYVRGQVKRRVGADG